MFYRYFKKKLGCKWGGNGKNVRFYRFRNSWAFHDYEGWMWKKEWGYKTPLAAVRGCARWLSEFSITRRRD